MARDPYWTRQRARALRPDRFTLLPVEIHYMIATLARNEALFQVNRKLHAIGTHGAMQRWLSQHYPSSQELASISAFHSTPELRSLKPFLTSPGCDMEAIRRNFEREFVATSIPFVERLTQDRNIPGLNNISDQDRLRFRADIHAFGSNRISQPGATTYDVDSGLLPSADVSSGATVFVQLGVLYGSISPSYLDFATENGMTCCRLLKVSAADGSVTFAERDLINRRVIPELHSYEIFSRADFSGPWNQSRVDVFCFLMGLVIPGEAMKTANYKIVRAAMRRGLTTALEHRQLQVVVALAGTPGFFLRRLLHSEDAPEGEDPVLVNGDCTPECMWSVPSVMNAIELARLRPHCPHRKEILVGIAWRFRRPWHISTKRGGSHLEALANQIFEEVGTRLFSNEYQHRIRSRAAGSVYLQHPEVD